MIYSVELPGREEVIVLTDLPKDKLLHYLDIAIDCENYEMCTVLKKYIDKYEI